jgi:small subunit ribosomal protein S13
MLALRRLALRAEPPLAACRARLSAAASPPAAAAAAPPSPPADASPADPLAAFAGMRRVLKMPAGALAVAKAPAKRGAPAVRLEGYSLPGQRGALHGLTAIFGVGRFQAGRLCAKAGVSETLRVADWTNTDIERLSAALKEMASEEANEGAPSHLRFEHGDRLKRRIGDDIQKLKTAGTYRGGRHQRGLPLRGQRTKSNAQSARRRPRYETSRSTA